MNTFFTKGVRHCLLYMFMLVSFLVQAQEPTTASSNLTFSNLDGNQFSLQWTNGNGASRIVVAKEGSPVTGVPTDGTDYLANSQFGKGNELAAGEFIIAKTTGSSAGISNLKGNTIYHFKIFEFNGNGAASDYLTTSFLLGSQSTLSAPTVQASNTSVDEIKGDRFRVNWTSGNGARRIVLIKEGSAVDADPVDLRNYYSRGDFGYGAQIGTGNYVIYGGRYATGNQITVTNLKPNVTYHYAIYEYNGSGGPVYLKPALRGSGKTNAYPQNAPTNLRFSGIEGNSMTLQWTRSDAKKYIVLASKTSIKAELVDGQEYIGNIEFGHANAHKFSDGSQVIYAGTSPSTGFTKLEPNTAYNFKVFAYNGSGTNTYYMRSPHLSGSQSTVSAPTVQASNGLIYQRSTTSIGLNWTKGNGQRRIVLMKEGSAVDADPVDLTNYYIRSDFGYGTQIGTGNYVVYGGYYGTGNQVNVTNLKENTIYHVAIYEFNGSNAPVYKTPPYRFIVSTFGAKPTIQVSNSNVSDIGASTAQVGCSKGDGPYRIVFAKKNSPVDFTPVDATKYIANNRFGTSDNLNNGNYAVYNGTAENFRLENLEMNTTYHLAFYEYNVNASGELYLTSSVHRNSFQTASPPSTAPSAFVLNSTTASTANFSWTNGNGNGRIVIVNTADTPSVPVSGTDYTANPALGSGSTIGTGSVVYIGSGNTASVSGLTEGTTYYVQIYEYNGTTYSPAVNTTPLKANFIPTDDQCPNDPNKTRPGVCGCGVEDIDTDKDGVADCIDKEVNSPCPNSVDAEGKSIDTDNDGTADCVDGCPTNDTKTAPGTCGCGSPDSDRDNDGLVDCLDQCPDDANKTKPGICGCGNSDTADTDNDGVLDCQDDEVNSVCASPVDERGVAIDTDKDGIKDCNDAEINSPCPNNVDGNGRSVDTDKDGIPDCKDNCVNIANPNQEDLDNDGQGDACDNDIDGDGVNNDTDCDPRDAAVKSNPGTFYKDDDGDGFGVDTDTTTSCGSVAGYASKSGDCNDADPNIYPNAQLLEFTGRLGFTNSIVSPLSGLPTDKYQIEVSYKDIRNKKPGFGYPRVIFDYGGDGVYNGQNDRTIVLSEDDIADVNTSDGKIYVGSISPLEASKDYKIFAEVIEGGCRIQLGPFDAPDVLVDADLEIFANDIQFDNPNPDVNSPLKITATVHNESDLPAENFVVGLVNQYDTNITYPDITIPYLAANSSIDVEWNITTPAEPAWCPMQVFVDKTNVIAESNELDNDAVRPFTNGDYNVPGAIEVSLNVSPSTAYPSRSMSYSGYAKYVDTAVPLADPSVAGATVTIELVEFGTKQTIHTSSNGIFSGRFSGAVAPGTYTVKASVTDYTLTGDATDTYEVITAPCYTNLSPSFAFQNTRMHNGTPYLIVGDTASGEIRITNNGCQDVRKPTKAGFEQGGGLPLLADTYDVPVLNKSQSHFIDLADMTFNTVGTFTFCATEDKTNQVVEQSENERSCRSIRVFPNTPDLVPYTGPSGSVYDCRIDQIGFSVQNVGAVPTSAGFKVKIDIYKNGTFNRTETVDLQAMDKFSTQAFAIPFTDPVGDYRFEMKIDNPPASPGAITETREDNNTATYTKKLLECKPDLSTVGCGSGLDVDGWDQLTLANHTYRTKIYNNGNAVAQAPIKVNFNVNGTIYTATHNTDLAPSASADISVTAPKPAGNTAPITVIVDPDNTINELNETNNQAKSDLCHEYQPSRPCGYGYDQFWGGSTRLQYQTTVPWVKLLSNKLYDAKQVTTKFEVEGPGLNGRVDLGEVTIQDVVACNYGCSARSVILPNSFVFSQLGTYKFTITVDSNNGYPECDETNNVITREITVVSKPDMRVLSQFINPSKLHPDVNEQITFNLTYENIGYNNIDDEMDLKVLVDEVELGTVENVKGLLTNTNTTVALPNPYSSNLPGAHIVRIIIDSKKEIGEINELNNEATRALIVGEAANLTFKTFTASNRQPSKGEEIQINATIENEGDIAANADVEFFYINGVGQEVFIGKKQISVQPNNATVDISQTWLAVKTDAEILGRITNVSELEFDENDNEARLRLGNDLKVTFNSTLVCSTSNTDGTLTANVTGGTAPYTYSWNTGATTQTLTSSTSGTFVVTVTDATGFMVEASGTIQDDENCVDLCPDDPNKKYPGSCGCGSPDTDTDKDGIADCLDDQPNSPCTNTDESGIAIDSDKDGVADCLDLEPNSPCPNAVDANGVSLDSDGDGIVDCQDTVILVALGNPTKSQALPNVSVRPTPANRWIPIYDNNNRIVAAIRANGNDLGNIEACLYVSSADGTRSVLAGKSEILRRSLTISPERQPTSAVDVRIYFKKDEFEDLKTASSQISTINDLVFSKVASDVCQVEFSNSQSAIAPVVNEYEGDYCAQFTVNSFSTFFASSTRALPLDLVKFEGFERQTTNELVWETLNEENVSKFEIQRSVNGIDWNTISEMKTKGGVNSTTYNYVDEQPIEKAYYRLVIVNLYEENQYSNIVYINRESSRKFVLYPNPATDVVQIKSVTDLEIESVQIYSQAGQLVKELDKMPANDVIYIGYFKAGVYHILLKTDKGTIRIPFVKQ